MNNDGMYFAAMGQVNQLRAELDALREALREAQAQAANKTKAEYNQAKLKSAALEELRRLDPNNNMLKQEYRDKLAAAFQAEYDCTVAMAAKAEQEAAAQGNKSFWGRMIG